MPIYEYVCPECKTKFELMRPISKSSEPADCPECKHTAERAISKFVCRASSEFSLTAPLGGGGGGSGCSGCAGGSFATCHS
jgi:putative FmdB family regulatory protein